MPNLSPAILALGASILLAACGQQTEDAAAILIDKASGLQACVPQDAHTTEQFDAERLNRLVR